MPLQIPGLPEPHHGHLGSWPIVQGMQPSAIAPEMFTGTLAAEGGVAAIALIAARRRRVRSSILLMRSSFPGHWPRSGRQADQDAWWIHRKADGPCGLELFPVLFLYFS